MKTRHIILIIAFLILFLRSSSVFALTPDELQQQIQTKEQQKAALDAQNAQLQVQIDATSQQAKTLQSTVQILDATQKKLTNNLNITQNQISTTQLSIQQLGIEVANNNQQIERNKQALAQSLRNLEEADDSSFIEAILKYNNLNELWTNIETLQNFQSSLKQDDDNLRQLTADNIDKENQNQQKTKDLTDLQSQLTDQKTIVDQNKNAKTQLLAQTEDRESKYEQQLAQNIQLGKEFESELFNHESQLNVNIDLSKFPAQQPGILSWPLDVVRITQKFGKTVDSKRLYVSGTHDGVDFGTPVGTPVKAVMSGVVVGFGNTDDEPKCYSYGRWLLIKHPDGLSSLYAHLSLAKVVVGQTVDTGQIIGYSGGQPGESGAGYSTGPHLHLGLFASQGVAVAQYTQSMFCKQVFIPLAPSDAYLDPLAYLPSISQ